MRREDERDKGREPLRERREYERIEKSREERSDNQREYRQITREELPPTLPVEETGGSDKK